MIFNKGIVMGGLLVVLGVIILAGGTYFAIYRSSLETELQESEGYTGFSSPSSVAKTCVTAGCYAELCIDEAAVGKLDQTCEYEQKYACYKELFARCEIQSNGECGWNEAPELAACIAGTAKPADAPPAGKTPPPAPTKLPSAKPNPAPIPTPVPQQSVTPTPPPTPQPSSFTIAADDSSFMPSGPLTVSRGSNVSITFKVSEVGTYYGGLTFRSNKFLDASGLPGETVVVTFAADESFTISSFWPASNVWKADLQVVVQ